MKIWKRRALAAAVAVAGMAAVLLPLVASAATPAVTVTSLNMRAGPGTQYPVVVAMPVRAPITVYGCAAGIAWCDVGWGRERGWVAANYIQVAYRGGVTVISPTVAPVIGVTVVAFNRAYWDHYYVGRAWYGGWDRYYGPRPPHAAAAGCVDGKCGAVGVSPGHAAIGHCADGTCSGTVAHRGLHGRWWVRHGSIGRD